MTLGYKRTADDEIYDLEDFLKRAMEALDDYLNAGDKASRQKAAEKAKSLYKEYYGVDYVNRVDRG